MWRQSCLMTMLVCVIVLVGASAEDTEWPEMRMEHKPSCYWWWPGSAVDKENITWNLETLQAAGMGGAHVIPIYGVKGAEDRYIEYLSPEWMEMGAHAVKEAERLSMWVDMSTGTGWPFGGPGVSAEDADVVAKYENGAVTTSIGRRVKRAAPGGAGNCVNPYSPEALGRYLATFDAAFKGYEDHLPRAQYHDSFEYAGDWSSELYDAFEARHGYDLREHLPEVFGEGEPDTVARIKSDYRETIGALHLQFVRNWHDWSHGHGCITRNQAHGAPGNLLDLYAAVDVPETETFGSTPFEIPGLRRKPENVRAGGNSTPMVNRMASSAAHVAGKRLVASETCTWLRNHFTAALAQIKPEIDQLLLNGINHMVYHGCCYSPKDAAWPGWLFYASTEFNPRNAFWRDISELNGYIARCQSVLQSGLPANDILVYWPIYDLWHNAEGMVQKLTVHDTEWLEGHSAGKVAAELVENGYAFDFISDAQLQSVTVEDGALTTGGVPYRVVLVPRCHVMPVETLQNLIRLAKEGATVVVHEALPEDVPGHGKLEERRERLRELLASLEGDVEANAAVRAVKLGSGRLVLSSDLNRLLAIGEVPREAVVELGIDFIRRTHEKGHHYFLANLEGQYVDQWVSFGMPFESAVIMDPRSGETGVAEVRQRRGAPQVYLQLQPGETRILRTFAQGEAKGNPWRSLKNTGHAVAVTGEWRVEFIDGGPELPASFTTDQLASWAHLGDEEAQRFAGTARYATDFEMPAGACDDWVLDLGEVRESARVRINGEYAGALWSIPFNMPVGKHLRPGKNTLDVEVTNLSANRIRDLDQRKVEWRIFHDINFVTHDYKPFDASVWEVMDSGLLGPVTLTPMRAVDTAKR